MTTIINNNYKLHTKKLNTTLNYNTNLQLLWFKSQKNSNANL